MGLLVISYFILIYIFQTASKCTLLLDKKNLKKYQSTKNQFNPKEN